MSTQPELLVDRLNSVFNRVFRREFSNHNIVVDEVEEWDSLSHIKLMMELESEFKVNIEAKHISDLYSSSETIIIIYLQDSGIME